MTSDQASPVARPERCGVFAIVGRPNVGKSTLLNRLVGQKVSITSRKPQTTRYKISGIANHGEVQLVFVDTPGWQGRPQGRLHKLMNQQIEHALQGVDGVLFVCDAGHWDDEDARALGALRGFSGQCYLVMNKVDRLLDKQSLLPLIGRLSTEFGFAEIFPVSAHTGENVSTLAAALAKTAPERPYLHDPEQLTDRPERFIAAELVREQAARQLGAELPYAVHVLVDRFVEQGGVVLIDATIWVEKPGQKAIVIGSQGQRIKKIGSAARLAIERLLGRRVYLKTWVKVRGKWTEDPAALEGFEPPRG
jgi:GTP-binding protein Era